MCGGMLPKLHPLIDLCNVASAAYAIPVALFNLYHIRGDLAVRQAGGDETYRIKQTETLLSHFHQRHVPQQCTEAHGIMMYLHDLIL